MMDIRMQSRNKQANDDLKDKKQNKHPHKDQITNKHFCLGVQINLERAQYFNEILGQVLQEIECECLQYNVNAVIMESEIIYQLWAFEFMGTNNFEGRCIKGVLKFQPDYPKCAPSFYFDPINTDKGAEVLVHQCIYGDHNLCVNLFRFWGQRKGVISEIQFLQAIECIFNHPSSSEEADSCPNPLFAFESPQRQQEIQKRQAEFLPFFEKAI